MSKIKLRSYKNGKQASFTGELTQTNLLGKGSFGTVFNVKQDDSNIPFALKIIRKKPPQTNNDLTLKEQRQNALSEVKKNVQLGRNAYFGESDGYYYIAVENFGTTLFDQFKEEEGKIHETLFFIQVFMRIASQVMQTQQHGYEHGDIKTQNIVGHDFHHPRLIDLDFAKKIRRDSLTSEGTPSYVAPEIITKELSKAQGKTDVFSLGVAFLSALSQVRCSKSIEKHYKGQSPEDILRKRIHSTDEFNQIISSLEEKVKSNPDESSRHSALMEILNKMLERDPEKRTNITNAYREIAKLRFSLELEIQKGNPDELKKLFQHNMASTKFEKRDIFTKALQKHPNLLEIMVPNTPEEIPKPEMDLQEAKSLEKCQKLIIKAKKHWDSELLKLAKSSHEKKKFVDDKTTAYYFKTFTLLIYTDKSQRNILSVELAHKPKTNLDSDSTLKQCKMLADKIDVANQLLKPHHNIQSFKALVVKNKETLTKDRSPITRRIVRSIFEILALPVAIIHTACKGTFIWRSHGSKLVSDVNKQIAYSEKRSDRTLTK